MPRAKPPRRTSITDVARHAGVSQSTVSYVLNGNRPISERTRKAVEDAIRELDYTPNSAARALRGERSRTLVLSSPSHDAYNDATVGIYFLEVAAAARRAGYDLLVATDPSERGAALQRITASGRADAAIVMSVVHNDARVRTLERTRGAAIAMGDPSQFSSMPFVDVDFAAGGRAAIEALARWGHRAVAYVAFSDEELNERLLYTARAIEGVQAAARAAGIELVMMASSRDPEEQERRLDTLFAHAPHPTALICSYLSGFDRARTRFLAENPGADAARSVIALGTTGRPGEAGADSTRTVHSVRDIAEAAVRLALLAVSGVRPPSVRLVPEFRALDSSDQPTQA